MEVQERFEGWIKAVNARIGRRSKGEICSIDDFVENNAITAVNFIKMDIEGGERDALYGAESTIKRFRPRLSICEYHGIFDRWYLRDVIRSFKCGYRIKSLGAVLYAWVPDGSR
jgi:hypothetical protein